MLRRRLRRDTRARAGSCSNEPCLQYTTKPRAQPYNAHIAPSKKRGALAKALGPRHLGLGDVFVVDILPPPPSKQALSPQKRRPPSARLGSSSTSTSAAIPLIQDSMLTFIRAQIRSLQHTHARTPSVLDTPPRAHRAPRGNSKVRTSRLRNVEISNTNPFMYPGRSAQRLKDAQKQVGSQDPRQGATFGVEPPRTTKYTQWAQVRPPSRLAPSYNP